MQNLTISCRNCLHRNKTCDGTRPICNTCIRDGQLCFGDDALDQPLPTPQAPPLASGSQRVGTSALTITPMSFRKTISTIVSTPSWIFQDNARQQPVLGTHCILSNMLYSRIPRSVTPDPRVPSNTLPFILNQYIRLVERIAFKSPPFYVRKGIEIRLHSSLIIFSSMSLGARIIQAMMDNFDNTDWGTYAGLIDRLHLRISTMPYESHDISYTEGLLAGIMELAGLKFITSDNASGYALLRKATPILVRTALQYPNIWSKQGEISLPRSMSASTFEICGFAWMDNIAALAFGTVPLLRYDTASHKKIRSHLPFEWLYGCPEEFLLQLVRINMLRSSQTRSQNDGTSDRWQYIENDIEAWVPTIDKSGESRDSVARLAVHESWRRALLCYLYMSVCGVNSADPRVESSVNQIVQLISVVKHREAFDRHMFIPCLLAGVCARREYQRAAVGQQLSSLRATRMWVLRSADFTSVLDHLWHGGAKDGRPTTWDDYVMSRRTVLPVNE